MTRNVLIILSILLTALLAVPVLAQDEVDEAETGPGQGNGLCEFIDEDGDGYNDLAPDADGDGIPNGMDEDYVKPEDGDGNQFRFGQAEGAESKAFGSDLDTERAGNGNGGGNAYGSGDGTGTGDGPADGTGFGPGDGDCLDGEDGSTDETQTQRRGDRS